jgi:hypothetical protein
MFEWFFENWFISRLLEEDVFLTLFLFPALIISAVMGAAGTLGLSATAILGPIIAGLMAGIAIIIGVLGGIWGVNRYAHRAFPLRVLMGGFHWLTALPLMLWILGRKAFLGIDSNAHFFQYMPWGFPGEEDPRIQECRRAAGEPSGSKEEDEVLEQRAKAVTIPDKTQRLSVLQTVQDKLRRMDIFVPLTGDIKD